MTISDTVLDTFLDSSRWDGKINIAGWTEGSGGSQEVVEPATGDILATSAWPQLPTRVAPPQ